MNFLWLFLLFAQLRALKINSPPSPGEIDSKRSSYRQLSERQVHYLNEEKLNDIGAQGSPTFFPTSTPSATDFPTSRPSLTPPERIGQQYQIIEITNAGVYTYTGKPTNKQFIINCGGDVMITGQRGKNHYKILPFANQVITITDFKKDGDVIDLLQYPTIDDIHDIGYSTYPLTLLLTDRQKIVLPLFTTMTLDPTRNFVFSSSITITTSAPAENNFWSRDLISAVAVLGVLCFLVFFFYFFYPKIKQILRLEEYKNLSDENDDNDDEERGRNHPTSPLLPSPAQRQRQPPAASPQPAPADAPKKKKKEAPPKATAARPAAKTNFSEESKSDEMASQVGLSLTSLAKEEDAAEKAKRKKKESFLQKKATGKDKEEKPLRKQRETKIAHKKKKKESDDSASELGKMSVASSALATEHLSVINRDLYSPFHQARVEVESSAPNRSGSEYDSENFGSLGSDWDLSDMGGDEFEELDAARLSDTK